MTERTKKPREFMHAHPDGDLERPDRSRYFHVVERSALTAAEAELAQVKVELREAHERIENLELQSKLYQDGNTHRDRVIIWNEQQLIKARTHIAALVSALEFYANQSRYFHYYDELEEITEIEHDNGHIARGALESMRGEE